MRRMGLIALLCGALLAAPLPAAAADVVTGSAGAVQAATITSNANLRLEPTTASPALTLLPAGTVVAVVCWATGEPTYGTDVYGSMWLFTTMGGWVHSYLVTPVEVPVCTPAMYGFYPYYPW